MSIKNETEKLSGSQVISELVKVGFLTRSRAFGTHEPESDYDIVYCVTETSHVRRIIKGLSIENSLYNSGYRVCLDRYDINLIPVSVDQKYKRPANIYICRSFVPSKSVRFTVEPSLLCLRCSVRIRQKQVDLRRYG